MGCSDVSGIALGPSFCNRPAASWLDNPLSAASTAPSALEMDAAEEPEHEQDNYHDSQDATQTGSAVTPVSVVAAASTEQQQYHHNDQK
jgi:hypothetical protein